MSETDTVRREFIDAALVIRQMCIAVFKETGGTVMEPPKLVAKCPADVAIRVRLSDAAEQIGSNPDRSLMWARAGALAVFALMLRQPGPKNADGKGNGEVILGTIDKNLDRIVHVLDKKHRDYGESAFSCPILAPYMPAGVENAARASDKLMRIRTLSDQTPSEGLESLVDSYEDFLGYCILEVTRLTRTLAEEVGSVKGKDPQVEKEPPKVV